MSVAQLKQAEMALIASSVSWGSTTGGRSPAGLGGTGPGWPALKMGIGFHGVMGGVVCAGISPRNILPA